MVTGASALLVLSAALTVMYLNARDVYKRQNEMALAKGGAAMIPLALGLMFIGGAGKSAMFPLHIWLPDAMEGPTPDVYKRQPYA